MKSKSCIAFIMLHLTTTAFGGELVADKCTKRCTEDTVSSKPIVADEIVTVSLYVDNDLLSAGHHDRDYTGGFAIAFSGTKAANHPFSIDRGLGLFNKATYDKARFAHTDFTMNSCEAGVTAFTPTDLTTSTPNHADRPYASLLYLSNSRQDIDLSSRQSWISTLTVGVLGLTLTGDIQNAIHQATGSEKAQGWSNQISQGGEPTFRYTLARLSHFDTNNPHLQVTGSVGAGVGFLTDASAGISMRYGRLRTPWWNLDEDSGKYGSKSHAEMPASRQLDEIYLIAGLNAQVRGYNSFLQGQFRHSEVSYSADEIRPFVYEGWIGIACEFKSGFRLSYIVRHQSSELNTGEGDRSFNYGALISTFRF